MESGSICPVRRKYPFKSGVNIMFGCNNFCSYCIVPDCTRKREKQKAGGYYKGNRGLAADGVVEVMLLART